MADDNTVHGFSERGAKELVETARRVRGMRPGRSGTTRRWPIMDQPSNGTVSNPCDMVRFQILVADSATRSALCHIMARPYGCAVDDVPGTVLDGLGIEVCDPIGCFLNETEDVLVGREGWAKYVTPISGGSSCQDGNYYITAEWEVFSLCCAVFNCNL